MQDTENILTSDPASVPAESTAGKLTPTQIEKIADENGEIYRRDIWKTSFKIRTQSMWAGGAFGIVAGACIGALAVLSTALVGASAIIGAIFWPVVGLFAAAGMVTAAVAAFPSIGLTTGAIVGREKVADRKKLLKNPLSELQDNVRYRGTVEEKQTFWNRIIPFTKGSEKIYNWRAGLILAAAGLAAGALLAATGAPLVIASAVPFIAHAIAVSGSAVSLQAVTACMTVTTLGLFGALFGLDGPTITANMTEFVAGIFSGKAFTRGKERTPELVKAAAATAAIPRSAQVKGPVAFKSTSSTLVSPIGAYAGMTPAKNLRKLAEQKFNTMQPSQGSSIN